jgi:integrase
VLEKVRGQKIYFPNEAGGAACTIGTHAKAALKTKDAREAKDRHPIALAHLHRFLDEARKGPRPLTHKQIVALSGHAYRMMANAFEDDPISPNFWRLWKEVNNMASRGEYGVAVQFMIGEHARQDASMERRFGAMADKILALHGVVTDSESRKRLIRELYKADSLAADKLERNADGDYRPDPEAERFPKWEKPQAVSKAGGLTFDALFEGWEREARSTGRTNKTIKTYRTTLGQFAAFLGHDDAAKVTQPDIVRWKEARLDDGISAKTVKATDLSALKSIFKWAANNSRLSTNPAEKVTMPAPKKAQERSSGFTNEEAKTILKAALAYKGGSQEHRRTAAAKRWAPWVCAYTGARIGEVLQLRRKDVAEHQGHWVITITPDAGTTKDKKRREVPLHSHLVELGFAELVNNGSEGYLFVSNPNGGLNGVKNRVSEFVRQYVSDPRVRPNHAWRHRFKTVGIDAGIAERVLDAICGHAPRTVGETYGQVTLKAKIDAIRKLPRYQVK